MGVVVVVVLKEMLVALMRTTAVACFIMLSISDVGVVVVQAAQETEIDSPPTLVETPSPVVARSFFPTHEPTASAAPSESSQPSAVESAGPTAEPTVTSSPTVAPTAYPECLSSLDLLESKMDNQNPFIQTTYTLCPNTEFIVGFPDGNGICCQGGQTAILPRSNTLIQCGEDGSSANNCTISSGQYQMMAIEPNYFENIENFIIRGVDFRDAGFSGLLLAQGGDLTFEDCIFSDHEHTGVVHMLWNPPETNRRLHARMEQVVQGIDDPKRRKWLVAAEYTAMIEGRGHQGIVPYDDLDDEYDSIYAYSGDEEEEDQQQELMQEESEGKEGQQQHQARRKASQFDRMRVNFIRCVFRNNRQGQKTSVTQSGIVSADSGYNDIYVEECIFVNNVFDVPPKGYAISAREGSSVDVRDSCFHFNEFRGNGTVEIIGNGAVQEANNAGVGNEDLVCDFLAHIPPGATEPECLPYERKRCPLVRFRDIIDRLGIDDDSYNTVSAATTTTKRQHWTLLWGGVFMTSVYLLLHAS